MNRPTSIILGILFAVLVVQLVIVAPRVVNQREAEDGQAEISISANGNVEQAMQSVHLMGTRDGKNEWELWAEKAISWKNREVWQLESVKTIIFGENGVSFTVVGERGTVEPKSRNMSVSGNVVTTSSNGYTFRAPEVSYLSKTRRLSSQQQVTMDGPADAKGHSLKLIGEGLDADMNSSMIDVKKHVRAEKMLGDGRKAIIRSQRAQFSGQEKIARFFGSVVVDMDATRITGPEAEFEYDSQTDLVKSMLVRGGARVSDAEKWATSQNVKVHFDQDRYVFRGSPRVVQNNDELRGEEIIFLDGGKRVIVQRARAKVDEKSMEKMQ